MRTALAYNKLNCGHIVFGQKKSIDEALNAIRRGIRIGVDGCRGRGYQRRTTFRGCTTGRESSTATGAQPLPARRSRDKSQLQRRRLSHGAVD